MYPDVQNHTGWAEALTLRGIETRQGRLVVATRVTILGPVRTDPDRVWVCQHDLGGRCHVLNLHAEALELVE